MSIVERADEAIRTADAFTAMKVFLRNYWDRGGQKSEDLADLLSGLAGQADGHPLDRAHWQDFLDAVDQTKGQTQ